MTDRELMQMSLEYLIEFGMGEMPTAKATYPTRST